MVDYYGGTILILALASCEIIAFNWIYGTSFIGTALYISYSQSQHQKSENDQGDLLLFKGAANYYLFLNKNWISSIQCRHLSS